MTRKWYVHDATHGHIVLSDGRWVDSRVTPPEWHDYMAQAMDAADRVTDVIFTPVVSYGFCNTSATAGKVGG